MDGLVALSTLALAIVTFWLALETRRIALATAEATALQHEPQLALVGLEHTYAFGRDDKETAEILTLRVALRNPGSVRVNYHVNSITESLTFPVCDMTKFATVGGVVFPGTETRFILPSAKIRHPQEGDMAHQVRLTIDISFFTTANAKRHRLRATLFGQVLNDWVDWHFADGPSYA
jgi:hypothetical protein